MGVLDQNVMFTFLNSRLPFCFSFFFVSELIVSVSACCLGMHCVYLGNCRVLAKLQLLTVAREKEEVVKETLFSW